MKPSAPAPQSSFREPALYRVWSGSDVRRGGHLRRLLAAGAVSLGLLLSACSSPAPGPVAPESPTTAGAGSAATPNPAEQARLKVQASVEKSLKGVSKPSTDAVRKALQAAVSPGVAVEVSNSVTPTGLEADSVVGAAVVAPKNCVFVYLRDGAVSTAVLPTLSNGKCFVGDQGAPRTGA
ncbi:hypothetical protein QFZ52_001720 [Arthrobacter woluwensis]|uniref:DUF6993 domain-containing protein n=1 Tax=Arthrobacter woluwensis TaxID=156980 RepID=UPI00277F282F|nr:hypothetical protein [Arthrobacter woluwensis]MDQ0709068.1 hypothetical protein [Arthrobacter woluwensis]